MSARRTRRLFLLVAATAMVYPAAAGAHATLIRSEPASGAVLAKAPRAVRLVFDDVVQPVGGNEVVRNAGGGSVTAGKPRLEGGGKVLVLPLRAHLRDGDYSVRWRALSDDGHFVSGVLAFAVGSGRAPPTAVLQAAAGNPSATDVLSRWLLFAGVLLAAGAAGFWLLALRPAVQRLGPHQQAAVERVERGRVAAVVIAGCALFVAGTAHVVQEVGWDTRFGLAFRVAAGVALVAAVCAAVSVVKRRLRAPAAAGAVAVAAAPSFAGHALDAGVPWPNVAVDLLHVYAAALWLGGLVGLLFVLPAAARAAAAPGFGPDVVRRVSRLAFGSVLVLAATGIVRAVYELRSIEQLWTTGYGRALLVKSGLLLVLAALGWTNRRRLGNTESVVRRVRAEALLFVGLVVAVAFLTQLRPGRSAPRAEAAPAAPASLAPPPRPPQGAVVLAREDGTYGVALAVASRAATVTVLSPSGGGADGLDVAVDGKRTSPCGHGCYAAALPSRRRRVVVTVAGHDVPFELPARPRPAASTMARATRAFLSLRSVEYLERLASSPTSFIVTRWRVEAPDRATYSISGGAQAIVIGGTRWDSASPGKPWQRAETSPLELPQPIWGEDVTNAYVLDSDARTLTISWANPTIPAWFTARFDRRTLHPLTLGMTAASHFMEERYLEFNRPLGIRPPR